MSETESKAPGTPTGTSAGGVTFTEKEQKVLNVVWQCMKSVPEIDMKKLTAAAGFNTEKTASNTWGTIKKKLATSAAANGVEVATPAKGKTTVSPKKRGKKDLDDDADVDDASGTSTKKPRKTPTKPKGQGKVKKDEDAVKEEEIDHEDRMEVSPAVAGA